MADYRNTPEKLVGQLDDVIANISETPRPTSCEDLLTFMEEIAIRDDIVREVGRMALREKVAAEDGNTPQQPYSNLYRFLNPEARDFGAEDISRNEADPFRDQMMALPSLVAPLLAYAFYDTSRDSQYHYLATMALVFSVIFTTIALAYPGVSSWRRDKKIKAHEIPEKIRPLVDSLLRVKAAVDEGNQEQLRRDLIRAEIEARAYQAGEETFQLGTGSGRYRIAVDDNKTRIVVRNEDDSSMRNVEEEDEDEKGVKRRRM